MGYGRIAVDTLRWDNAGTPTDLDVGTIANTTSPVFTGDVTLTGSSYDVVFDASDSSLEFADNAKATFGAGNDLELHHDGNSYINNTTANQLAIQSNDLKLRSYTDLENYLVATHNGSVDIFFNGVKKLETSATGCIISGSVTDDKGNLRDIPVNAQSSAVTLATSDAGKVVATTSGGWVIPNNTFSNGNTITLLNNSNSGQNIDASALGTALYNGADGANIKSNTITVGGRSMATIWFDQGTVAYIQGSSLTIS